MGGDAEAEREDSTASAHARGQRVSTRFTRCVGAGGEAAAAAAAEGDKVMDGADPRGRPPPISPFLPAPCRQTGHLRLARRQRSLQSRYRGHLPVLWGRPERQRHDDGGVLLLRSIC